MYMDNIKLFAKKGKEQKIVIQAVRIYSEDIGWNLAEKNVPC